MYEVDQVLLRLSAMDELVNGTTKRSCVAIPGFKVNLIFINSVNSILSTIGTTNTLPRGQELHAICSIR